MNSNWKRKCIHLIVLHVCLPNPRQCLHMPANSLIDLLMFPKADRPHTFIARISFLAGLVYHVTPQDYPRLSM